MGNIGVLVTASGNFTIFLLLVLRGMNIKIQETFKLAEKKSLETKEKEM